MFAAARRLLSTALALAAGLLAVRSAAQEGTQKWVLTVNGGVASAPSLSNGASSGYVIYVGTEGYGINTTAGRVFGVGPAGGIRFQFTGVADWVDSSPAVGTDGSLYFGSWDYKIYSINSAGTARWSRSTAGFVAGSPALGSDGTVYLGSGDRNLYALDASNGSVKWTYPVADWIDSSPAVGPEDTIYFGSYDNNIYAVRANGTLRWQFTTGDNVTSSPAIGADATVYIGSSDGKLYALDGATGTLKWSYTTGGGISASPIVGADGTIYVGSLDGYFYAINSSGGLNWRYNVGNEIYSTAALRSDGTLFFGASFYLYALNADGSLRWRFLTGDYVDSSPVIAGDGTIYVGSSDKKLYAINGNGNGPATDAPWPMFRQNSQRTGRSPVTTFPSTPTVTAPSITAQPSAIVVNQGDSASFSVGASGTDPLSYQWYRDGAPISGATSATYSIAAAQLSDAGTYTVQVGNSAGNATSSGATLTVNAPAAAPTITAAPSPLTVNEGASAAFSVSATGTAPLSYQWYLDGAAISGATSATYSIAAAQLSDAGTYSVRVSNSLGHADSSGATLTVNQIVIAPSIVTPPSAVTVTEGQAASFTVVAAGTAPLTYQWYRNGSLITGATSATYTINPVQLADAGNYSVRVRNAAGHADTTGYPLTVNELIVAPSIVTSPSALTVTEGQGATFSVVATGTAPLTYQWYRNGAPISGANSASYTINPVQLTDAGTFSVRVSNSLGQADSSGATLAVDALVIAPSITVQPAAQTGEVGGGATFSVSAGGTAPFTYQWSRNGQPLDGASGASLTLTNLQLIDAGDYTVTVTNAAGTATSAAAALTVNRLAQTITFAGPADQGFTFAPLTLTASSSSNLPVSFTLLSGPATLSGAALALTGPGVVTVRADQAGDSTYAPASAVTRTFTVAANYAYWTLQHFTADELLAGTPSAPTTIATGDGLPNLVKYALGLAAKTPATAADWPAIGTGTAEWTYTFRRPSGQTDVSVTVEASSDLVAWSTSGVALTLDHTTDGVETWVATVPSAGRSTVFFRLRVAQP